MTAATTRPTKGADALFGGRIFLPYNTPVIKTDPQKKYHKSFNYQTMDFKNDMAEFGFRRARCNQLPREMSIRTMLDSVMENTVRQFVKNLVLDEWRGIFDSHFGTSKDEIVSRNGVPITANDMTMMDEADPLMSHVARHMELVESAMEQWRIMTNRRHGNVILDYNVDFYPDNRNATNKFGAAFHEKYEEPVVEDKPRLTAYQRFCKKNYQSIKAENPNLKFGQISKEIGKRWRALSKQEKKECSKLRFPKDQHAETQPARKPRAGTRKKKFFDGVAPIIAQESQGDMTPRQIHKRMERLWRIEKENGRASPASSDNDEPADPVMKKDYMSGEVPMTMSEERALDIYNRASYDNLLTELIHNNIVVPETTPPTPEKRREVINALMNWTFTN